MITHEDILPAPTQEGEVLIQELVHKGIHTRIRRRAVVSDEDFGISWDAGHFFRVRRSWLL